jgi:hypothetical protein
MSLVLSKQIETRLAIDPRISEIKPVYTINKGGTQVTYVQQKSDNNSNSSIQFNPQVPGSNTYMDRKMYVHMTARVTFTGTPRDPDGPNLLFPNGLNGVVGLRWCPLQSVTDSFNLTLNSNTITLNPAHYLEAMARYGFDRSIEDTFISTFPSMQDTWQQYSDGFGANNNPIAPYGDNTSVQSRGSFPYTIVSDNGSVAIVDFEWTELIICSPLCISKRDEQGFYGLTNLRVQFTLTNINRLVSVDDTNGPILSELPTVIFPTEPILNMSFITPPMIASPPIGSLQMYPFTLVQEYAITRTGLNLTPGSAPVQLVSNNVVVAAVPTRMYIFAKKAYSSLDCYDTDTYLGITNLQILFNNNSNLLASAQETDLYSMSERNGLKMSWTQWKTYTGAVVCVDFSKDISLADNLAVGVSGNYNLQVSAYVKNLHDETLQDVDLRCIVLIEGIFSMENMRASVENGLISVEDLLATEQSGTKIDYHQADTFYGGNVRKLISMYSPQIKQAARAAAKVAVPLAKKYGPRVAKAVGRAVAPRVTGVAEELFGDGFDEEGDYEEDYEGGALVERAEMLVQAPAERNRSSGSRNRLTTRRLA